MAKPRFQIPLQQFNEGPLFRGVPTGERGEPGFPNLPLPFPFVVVGGLEGGIESILQYPVCDQCPGEGIHRSQQFLQGRAAKGSLKKHLPTVD